MPILIRFLVSLYWSGSKAADRTLLGDFGGRRQGPGWQLTLSLIGMTLGRVRAGSAPLLAFCTGRNQFPITHLDSRSPGGFPNGGWDPRKGSGEDAVFVTSGRDTPGVLNLRRAWGEAEAGIQRAQVIQVIGGTVVALRVNGHGQGALARWRTQDGCFGFRERGLGRVGRFGSRGQHRRTRGLEPAYRPDPADCPERRSTSGWPTIRTESRHPLQKHCVTGQVTKSRGRAVGSIIQMAVDFISSAPPAS